MPHAWPGPRTHRVAIVGGGPAGLMAAEVLLQDPALEVAVYETKPSVGRKFLLAGKGGLNLTHSEPIGTFLTRYDDRAGILAPIIHAFDPTALRAWAQELGIGTFVGTSGRVFPTEMKAAPLLRAWLQRLRQAGLQLHTRHRCVRMRSPADLQFDTPRGELAMRADAVILACGGASWPTLGSDGAWVQWLADTSDAVNPLQPANCGFEIGWSEHFRQRFAGTPVKTVAAGVGPASPIDRQGEFVITEHGVEGSLIYALARSLRETIAVHGDVLLRLDLAPSRSLATLTARLARPRGARSVANHLRANAGIEGVKAGLLREVLTREQFDDPVALARSIKALPLRLVRTRPIEEAISTAGGVRFESLDDMLMLRSRPGVFCAGEMLDWEAPTGGYLLTASFATGRQAALGARRWLARRPTPGPIGSTGATQAGDQDG